MNSVGRKKLSLHGWRRNIEGHQQQFGFYICFLSEKTNFGLQLQNFYVINIDMNIEDEL